MSLLGRCYEFALGISPVETTFARRGFRAADGTVRQHLERIGQSFVQGYHAALRESDDIRIAAACNQLSLVYRGFAFEGAAMGVALLDHVVPWRRDRFVRFLRGAGRGHRYMVHVGAGWAAARLPWLRYCMLKYVDTFDPLLKWLVVDGYGFHEGYFHPKRYFRASGETESCFRIPRSLSGYAVRAFLQGLGRSLWFVEGAEPTAIADSIRRFPLEQRGDLWGGVGLASSYAGGVDRLVLDRLFSLAGGHTSCLAQGAAFAAKARELSATPTEHTDLACHVLCGHSAEVAAAITDETAVGLADESGFPAYEVWRQRIRSRLGADSPRTNGQGSPAHSH